VGPCYRCLFPEPPPPGVVPSCAEAGVLGVLPGVIGSIQATETIKLLLGAGDTLVGRLLLYDALEMRFREMRLRKDPRCPICGEHPTIHELQDYDALCGVQSHAAEGIEMTVRELADRLARGDDLLLVDVREPFELAIARFPQAMHVLACQKGVRSMRALEILREMGFSRLKNLAGGIDAWSREVDSSVPRY